MEDMLFDTHAHLIAEDWDKYPPSLLRGATTHFPPKASATAEWLIEQMDRFGVGKTCIVQRGHTYGYDNSYIIESGKKFPDRFVPVVILDAQDPATPQVLTDMVNKDGVRGVRFAQTHFTDYDTAWMNSPTAMECWRTAAELEIPVAIIFYRIHLSWTLPALKFIAETYPSAKIIVDHTGTRYNAANGEVARNIPLGLDNSLPDGPDFGISDTIGIFEELPNVHIKFTEINLERIKDKGADPADFVRALADRFGADRLIWGSDLGQSEWPYAEKAAAARAAAGKLDAGERHAFLYGTAERLYTR